MIFQKLRELAATKRKTLLCLLASFALALAAGTGCGHKAPPRPTDAPVKKKKGLSGDSGSPASSKSDNKNSKDTSDPFMDSNENKNNVNIKNNNTKNGDNSKPVAPSKENPDKNP